MWVIFSSGEKTLFEKHCLKKRGWGTAYSTGAGGVGILSNNISMAQSLFWKKSNKNECRKLNFYVVLNLKSSSLEKES